MKMRLMAAMVAAAAIALAAAQGARAAEVSALWEQHCVSCHAKDGSGNTRMGKRAGAKDYRDPKVQAEMKDDKAIKVVREGLTEGGKEKMKPFKDKLSDAEVKALIAHMRTFEKK